MQLSTDSRRKLLCATAVYLLSASLVFSQTTPATWYIDATGGNDQNDGLSPQAAWQSMEKISGTTFNPGDSILLKAGEVWTGQLVLRGSGEPNNPIRLDSYGEGAKPVIHGSGQLYTIYLYNEEYWELNNLEITNFNEQEEGLALVYWEENNRSYWAETNITRPQFDGVRSRKCAILVEAEDCGAIHHLHFTNLEIHGVNGDMSSKDNGGIFLEIKGASVETYFDELLVENCHIHDVDRTGLSNKSTWMDRSLYENDNWVPSKQVIYRNNTFERTGANAMIVRVADSAMIEGNLFSYCSIKGSGNANFPFNCDNIIIQYNEAHHTRYNEGDNDASGFDSDYRCKNTIIQYNYSHDNDYGGIVTTCQGGSNRFNDGSIIRYNLFQNNRRHVIRVSGVPTNTVIHNNVIYIPEGNNQNELIWHKSWKGYPDGTSYYNNIFYNLGSGNEYDLGSSTNNLFEHNLFYGTSASNEPYDAYKIKADPLFIDPGTDEPNGFKIQPNSPARATGKVLAVHAGKDYFGNPVPEDGPVDIGMHQHEWPLNTGRIAGKETSWDIQLHPNPVHSHLRVTCRNLPARIERWEIIDGTGRSGRITGEADAHNATFPLDIELPASVMNPGLYFIRFRLQNGLKISQPFIYY